MRILMTLAALSLVIAAPACDKKADDKAKAKAGDKAPAAKKANPCDGKKANPCDGKKGNPCDGKKANPCDGKKAEAPAKAEAKPVVKKAAGAVEQYVRFEVMHHDKAKGLVKGQFDKFSVTKANVDLKDPSKAFAEIDIDMASFGSGLAKRDGHVKSPDFFDVAKFTTAKLKVDKVTAKGDAFAATATLNLHGVTKSFPVEFKVVEKLADGAVVIEGTKADFKRMDFQVGAAPAKTNVAEAVKVTLRLKLATTK